jgi:hypothetical protein
MTMGDERASFRVSKMIPLTKDFQLPFSDVEIKMTIRDAQEYLNKEDLA